MKETLTVKISTSLFDKNDTFVPFLSKSDDFYHFSRFITRPAKGKLQNRTHFSQKNDF